MAEHGRGRDGFYGKRSLCSGIFGCGCGLLEFDRLGYGGFGVELCVGFGNGGFLRNLGGFAVIGGDIFCGFRLGLRGLVHGFNLIILTVQFVLLGYAVEPLNQAVVKGDGYGVAVGILGGAAGQSGAVKEAEIIADGFGKEMGDTGVAAVGKSNVVAE